MATGIGNNCMSVDEALKRINDLNRNMHLPPTECSLKCNYAGSNPEQLQKLVEKVAAYVSNVYARFPRLSLMEKQYLWEQKVAMERQNSSMPPETECYQFEINLKKKIISVLNDDENIRNCIRLSTNYNPEGLLLKVCKNSFKRKDTLYLLFPHNTLTCIQFHAVKMELRLEMNFRDLTS